MKSNKILIMGLPGSGKTTLSKELALLLNAVHFNADEIRKNINKDLGFSSKDRIEQARRMGWLCDQVAKTDSYVIADFVCPTHKTRRAFGKCFLVFLDTIDKSKYKDTNKLFSAPKFVDFLIKRKSAKFYAKKIQNIIDKKRLKI
ncbi:MAG: adenylyl-sulfate kinase [Nanoarchaeota archaeon]